MLSIIMTLSLPTIWYSNPCQICQREIQKIVPSWIDSWWSGNNQGKTTATCCKSFKKCNFREARTINSFLRHKMKKRNLSSHSFLTESSTMAKYHTRWKINKAGHSSTTSSTASSSPRTQCYRVPKTLNSPTPCPCPAHLPQWRIRNP